MHRPISDYAMIGDCETAALVGRNGSIDWLCWPRFDSGACFASLLGRAEHGYWQVAPKGKPDAVSRSYRGDTLVLETRFEADGGSVSVIDFMPIRETDAVSELIRIVVGRRGSVTMQSRLALRFDYGRIVPWTTSIDSRRCRTIAGPHMAILDTPVDVNEEDHTLVAEFVVREGERVPFALSYEASHLPLPRQPDAEAALASTERYWTDWVDGSRYDGPWHDAVTRSLITIKALTYRRTGGVVAAPTTSLPELIGGTRNWDYRYCWLRDAMFTMMSLINCGYRKEAEAWADWLVRAVAGAGSQVQPVYGIGGEHRTPEIELSWLPGYCDSRPVRTGNEAHGQLQLDVYGSVIDTLFEARRFGLEVREASDQLQCELLAHLEKVWDQPDEGIWEVRDAETHFVHSKLMCWVAFDRAIESARRFGLEGPVDRWKTLRDTIHAEVLERGFDPKVGAFTQTYDSQRLDAAVLQIPLVGFLPADDPRVCSTADVIERELGRDGLLLRYDTEEVPDGLPPGEGAFLACTFWLADNRLLQGRRDDAQALMERVLALRNDVGLLAEEYDVERGVLCGNFPQAFSHFALIDTALNFSGRGTCQEASIHEHGASSDS